MTAYGLAHLVIALACAACGLARAFLSPKVFVSPEPVHRWGVVAMVGFALLNAGIAASGAHSGLALGDTRPWIVIAFAGAVMLYVGPLAVTWGILDKPWTRGMRIAVTGIVVLGVGRLLEVALLVAPAGPRVTFEDVYYAHTLLSLPAKLAVAVVAVVLSRDGMRAARLGETDNSRVVLICALPSVVLLGREVAIASGRYDGATLVGVVGLPFVFATIILLRSRYLAAQRLSNDLLQIDGYRIVRPLAAGGMGELFLGERIGAGGFVRHVAIKRVRAGNLPAATAARLLEEARLAGRLSHPNVIAVHDVGRLPADREWFIAMEYLSGLSLRELKGMARQRGVGLPTALVTEVIGCVADGLAHAHDAGVTHGDVSPANVMVTYDGVVKVIDFGVAREAGVDVAPGSIVGKLPYLPPEALSGRGNAGPGGDVWALGVMLHEMIAGALPFPGSTPAEVLASIRAGRSRVQLGAISGELEAILTRCLAPDPALRYADAREPAEALRALRISLPRVDLRKFVLDVCGEKWVADRNSVTGSSAVTEDLPRAAATETNVARL